MVQGFASSTGTGPWFPLIKIMEIPDRYSFLLGEEGSTKVKKRADDNFQRMLKKRGSIEVTEFVEHLKKTKSSNEITEIFSDYSSLVQHYGKYKVSAFSDDEYMSFFNSHRRALGLPSLNNRRTRPQSPSDLLLPLFNSSTQYLRRNQNNNNELTQEDINALLWPESRSDSNGDINDKTR